MATRIRKTNPVYATASATYNHGYGHVNIHIYELMGYRGATLKISCQSGGESSRGETYAWEHGVSNDYSVLGTDTLKKAYWLMRRIGRLMEKERDENGSPRSYADYALRVLRAAGVRKVHLLPGVNPGYIGDAQTLPSLDPRKQGDLLFENLRLMEEKIISMS